MREIKAINEIKIQDMIEYCQEHGKIDWLKENAHKIEKAERKKKVSYTDENGEVKEREVVEEVEQEISFITLRARFVDEFMPEIKKGVKKKATFRDLIDAL